MNHKEEAIKRVEEFESFSNLDIEQRISSWHSAKQCALLAINREIELVKYIDDYLENNGTLDFLLLRDLIKVKKEIELL